MRWTPLIFAGLLSLAACGGSADPVAPDPPEPPVPVEFAVRNRLPQPEELNAVSELGGRFVAVGDAGSILVREAGQPDWVPGRLPTTARLEDVLQLEGNIILVAARDGIWLSRDAGGSWSHVERNADFSRLAHNGGRAIAAGATQAYFSADLEKWELADIGLGARCVALAFPSPEEAWAITSRGMLRSGDGGKIWVPTGDLPGNDNFEAMAFPEPGVGVLSITTGDIHLTTNGVDFDLVAEIPGRVVGMEFNSAEQGFLVATGGLVYETGDGGKTWSLLGTIPDPAAPRAIAADVLGHVSVVGRAGLVVDRLPGSSSLVEFSSGPQHTFHVLAPWSAQDALAIARLRSDPHVLLRTNDGGSGWEPQPSPVADPVDLEFLGPGLGMIVGRQGEVMVSRDTGVGWSDAGVPDTGRPLAGCLLLDEQTWLVGGQGGLVLRTADGGASWVELELPGASSQVVYDFERFPGTSVVLAQLSGTVFRSPDRGQSWEAVEGFVFPEGLACADANTAVAVGASIYRSTDQGRSWEEVLDEFFTLLSVRFLDARQGLAVGERGEAWETLDGGASWQERRVGSQDIFDVVVRPDGVLVLVGDDGLVVEARRPPPE